MKSTWINDFRENSKTPRPPSTISAIRGIVFALFLAAGNVKADPRLELLPVDMTLMFAVMTMLCMLQVFIEARGRIDNLLIGVLTAFALLAIPLLYSYPQTSYSADKVIRMFTLTLLAGLAPVFLLRSHDDLSWFIRGLGLVGALVALDVLTTYSLSVNTSRFVATGADTIATGQMVGVIALLTIFFGLEQSTLLFGMHSLLFVMLLAMLVGTGSRGPLLATISAFVATVLVSFVRNGLHRGKGRLLFASIVFCASILLSISIVPSASSDRLIRLLSTNSGLMGESRVNFYSESYRSIAEEPFGIGWGGFERLSSGAHRYPHNVILEVTLEGGWLMGFMTIFILVFSLYRASHYAVVEKTPYGLILLALLVSSLISSFFTGDINDNRMMISFVVVGIRYGESGAILTNRIKWGNVVQDSWGKTLLRRRALG